MLVQQFLEDSAARLPNKVALVCGSERLSYSEIDHRTGLVARRLVALGVTRHDRVAVFLDNSTEHVVAFFGVLKAGAIAIPVSPTMKARKLGYILRDSGARVLIAGAEKALVVRESAEQATELRHVVWCRRPGAPVNREATDLPSGVSSVEWSSVLASPANAALPRCIDVDLATIIYTSGSTGEPKGVMCAHCNVVAAARSITQYLENVEDDVILDTLPLSFDYGLYQVFMAFLVGATVVLERSFAYPHQVLESLVRERVTGFPLVPTMAAILLQMEELAAMDLGALRYVTNTAAALPVAYVRRLQALLPGVRIYSMYGLTECKRTAYLPPERLSERPDSVGLPIPNEEVFILDDAGREVAPGEIGELVVRGSNVMQGYWNAPEETARKFRPGRWRGETLLHTGDLFRRDSEGFLYFVARKDDMIKTKGERVSPREIEDVVCEMEGVAEAAVVGVPEDVAGHVIKACVVLRDGRTIGEEEIRKHCSAHLEAFAVPKYVEIRASLPRTPNGKIDKKALV
ncbi:MAG: AMP-binding protein [Candidatus Eiseniibacteriota bacterium]